VIPTSASRPDGQRLTAGCAMIASSSPVVAASVRWIPDGVLSKAHASTTAIGNPRIDTNAIPVVKLSGRWSAGTRMSAT
jgi:hypothetical protein